MRKAIQIAIVVAVLANAVAALAVAPPVGLSSTQQVNLYVDAPNEGWAVWVDYYDNSYQWHGPYYVDFYVEWSPVYFDQYYGVFAYDSTAGTYTDVQFTYATY